MPQRLPAGFGPSFAPYPANGYPAIDFMGANALSPRSTGSGGAANMAGAASGSQSGVTQLLPHTIAKSTPLSIIVVVLVGYLIWHFTSRV